MIKKDSTPNLPVRKGRFFVWVLVACVALTAIAPLIKAFMG